MRFVDCQGFAGGFTLGMAQAGFHLAGKREGKVGFGIDMVEGNRDHLPGNWKSQASVPAEWEPISDVDVVAGNPPCSGFSMMSVLAGPKNTDYRGIDAPSNNCMWELVEYAASCKPKVVVFESVQGAYKMGRPLMQQLRDDLEARTKKKWRLTHVLHNAAGVGGPSIRARYFFVASRVPFGIDPPEVIGVPTFDDAVGDLAKLKLQWDEQPYRSGGSWWSSHRHNLTDMVNGHDVLHLDNPHMKRLAGVLALPTGWHQKETLITAVHRYHEATGLWPANFNEANKQQMIRTEWKSGMHQPKRWPDNVAARVLAGHALNHVIHPTQDRTLTFREVARLMGFPDDWHLEPYRDTPNGYAGFGKGITVDCGKWIGGWIKDAIDEDPGCYEGELIGEREYLMQFTHHHKMAYNERTGAREDTRSASYRKMMEEQCLVAA